MYQMTPVYFRSDGDIDRYTDVLVKAVLLVAATIAVVALALLIMAGIYMGWLRFINWCNAELSTFACSLYLAGF